MPKITKDLSIKNWIPFLMSATFAYLLVLANQHQYLKGWIQNQSNKTNEFLLREQSPIIFKNGTEKYGLNVYKYYLPNLGGTSHSMKDGSTNLRGEYLLGPGIAIADFNQDGFMDIFLPNGNINHPSRLLINKAGKGFEDQAEKWGVASINNESSSALSPVILDYNSDGRPDLLITGVGCTKLYENLGSHFLDVTELKLPKNCKNSQGAVVGDFNGDGKPDLYIIRYFPDFNMFDPKTEFIWPKNTYSANNGGQDSLLLNSENNIFLDVTETLLPKATGWAIDAGIGNFRNSGKQNLYVANDFGPDFLFEIEKNGHFINKSHELGVPDRRYGMNVSLLDLDGSGFPHIYISNVYYPRFNERGNFLWNFSTPQSSKDLAKTYGLDNCLFAWGGAFADLNLDGNIDGYVANGFVSRKAKDSISDGFVLATFVGMPGFLTSNLSLSMRENIPFRSGHQVDCVFTNSGKKLINTSKSAGIRYSWDGRAVAIIDRNNNGVLDLIVTTREGNAYYLENQTSPSSNWIGFSLAGKGGGHPMPIGTRIKVMQDNKSYFRWDSGGKSGFIAYSDPRLHFGLKNNSPVSVKIDWASGQITDLRNLETGKYYVVEEK